MAKLRVSFLAGRFGFAPNDQAVLGSFIWDSTSNTFSDVRLLSFGPYQFQETDGEPTFSPPPGGTYPPGSLIQFRFPATTAGIGFSLNCNDHGYLDPPIIPGPGVYNGLPFNIGGPGLGRNCPGTGSIIVT